MISKKPKRASAIALLQKLFHALDYGWMSLKGGSTLRCSLDTLGILI